jgi:hypothetical protein
MDFTGKQSPDDEVLVRYLVGALPDEEAERLDELSIADDGFAARLDEAENDLVDAYARGRLTGETLERFRSFYLASPERMKKVALAEALLAREKRTARPRVAILRPRSLLGMAAALLLVTGAYRLAENLRRPGGNTAPPVAAVKAPVVRAPGPAQPEPIAPAPTPAPAPRIVALLLLPQTRGVARPPSVSVPPGTDFLALRLQLDSADFTSYRALLRDPATGGEVWNSGVLRAAGPVVTIRIPAGLLKTQNYSVGLTGTSGRGTAPEFVEGYSFRAVLQ